MGRRCGPQSATRADMEAQRQAALEIAFEAQERSIRKGEHDRIVRELHDNILQELFVVTDTLGKTGDGIVSSEKCSKCLKISTDIRAIISDSKERDGDPLLETLRILCRMGRCSGIQG